jgi:hypothetical protein
MFPDPNNGPALILKQRGIFFISLDIGADFFHPEILPGLRLLKTDRAFMPETAVDKNRDFLFGEDNIRLARKIVMDPVSSDSHFIEHLTKFYFRSGIFSPDAGHIEFPLFLSENISHVFLLSLFNPEIFETASVFENGIFLKKLFIS